VQIGPKLHILRLEDCFRTPLGLRSEFAATQHRLSLFEIGVTARELSRQALVVRHRGFHLLLRRRMSLIQTLLALALGVGANQVRTYCLPASFSCGDLRLCLIDTGKRFAIRASCNSRWRRLFSMAARPASTAALAWSTCAR